MSFAAIQQVYRLSGIPPTQKAILLCLAFHTNSKTGKCCPTEELIARETGYNVRTVQRALYWLQHHHLISVTRKTHGHGKITSNFYTLHLDQHDSLSSCSDQHDSLSCCCVDQYDSLSSALTIEPKEEKKEEGNGFCEHREINQLLEGIWQRQC